MSKPLDFPIPFPSQMPNDDLFSARMMIQTVANQMEDGKGLSSSVAQALFSVLCAAMTELKIIQLFLDDVECPDMEKQYQNARRSWVLSNGGAS
ncbi:hypothetical protein ASD50_21670 [Mesorhizobium sp. Root552]|uniref:hypothetical protein n=1 Tax=Mesorhizobium sp. Root552 TaxID=1736555 RepID=UPI0006FF8A99|nr:hypothetical protein [Mesorhizobium sp. Root552]KQZ20303.1 hypothetical protein ASD50_21670 [Mesorhizobium sp. Root552]